MPRQKTGHATQIKFSVHESLRTQLGELAKAAGRSLNAEINERLVQSLRPPRYWDTVDNPKINALVDLVAEVVCSAGQNAGSFARLPQDGAVTWADDPYCYDQVMKAVVAALEGMRPPGKIAPPKSASGAEFYSRIGELVAEGILCEVALKTLPGAPEVRDERAVRLSRGLGDDIVGRIERKMR